MNRRTDLEAEDQKILDAVAGLRAGTAAERAMRDELLAYAEAVDQAPGTEIKLSPEDVAQRERTRRLLASQGLLPKLQAGGSPGRSDAAPWFSRIGQFFGGGGAPSLQWSAGLAAVFLVAGAALGIAQWHKESGSTTVQTASDQTVPTLRVPDYSAYCEKLGANLQSGLPGAQVVLSPGDQGCKLQVESKDPAVQVAAQEIFAAAGAKVGVSPNMEILVQEVTHSPLPADGSSAPGSEPRN